MTLNDTLRNQFYDSITDFSQALMPLRLKLLADLDINLSQEELLAAYDAPQSIKQIALSLSITSSAGTQLVESLESAGLVTRERSSEDRRVVIVSLTAAGRKKQLQVLDARRRLITAMVNSLTPTEVNKLLKIQAKIIKSLEETNQ